MSKEGQTTWQPTEARPLKEETRRKKFWTHPERNDPMAVVIGAYLERLRDLAGFTQEKLARACEVNQSDISQLELGHLFHFDVYHLALTALGVRPAVFYRKAEEGVAELNKIAKRDGVRDFEAVRAKAIRGLAQWLAEVHIPEDFLKGGRRLDA